MNGNMYNLLLFVIKNNKQQNYSMQSSKQNYFYEQKNQNFPELFHDPPPRKHQAIGKILSKYQAHKHEPSQTSLEKPVHVGIPINYSQIYNDLKMPAASPAQQEAKIVDIPQSQKNLTEVNKSPYHFQSAAEMRTSFNKKNLPGIIVGTPRSQSRNNEISMNNQKNEQKKVKNQPQTYKYRVRDIRDRQQKMINFQQISELEAVSDHSFKITNKQEKKPIKEELQKISAEEKLQNSRSIGVGNHSIHEQNELQYKEEHSQEKLSQQNERRVKELTAVEEEKEKTLTQQKNSQGKVEQNEEIIVHYEKNASKVHQNGVKEQNGSRIASTIRHNADQSHFVEEIDEHVNLDHPEDKGEKSSKEDEDEFETPFSIETYTQVYPILKSIQAALKASLINVQEILRGIKKYLEIIAMGSLDNIDEFNLPLHKKKIIKNAIFYERVAVIVIAFAYATKTIKDSHKYLINVLSYSLNNSLILVKVLEQSQIPKYHQNESKNRTLIKSDKLSMKRNLDSLRNNNDVLIDSIYKLSKYEEVFYENLKQTIKLINKSSLQQTFYNVLEYFSFYLSVSDLGHMVPFLAVAPDPYLTPTIGKKYTLVVDVLELFCHGTKKSKTFVFRPYSQHFLHEMSQYYEIVSFCSAFPNQIDKIIDMVDPKGYIQHRLYKHHTVQKNKMSIKFVQRLGRPSNQLILLDNESQGGQGSLDNCIHIPPWKGNKNDTILAELCPLLAMIPIKKIDAHTAVNKVRQQAFKNKKEGVKYINFGVILD